MASREEAIKLVDQELIRSGNPTAAFSFADGYSSDEEYGVQSREPLNAIDLERYNKSENAELRNSYDSLAADFLEVLSSHGLNYYLEKNLELQQEIDKLEAENAAKKKILSEQLPEQLPSDRMWRKQVREIIDKFVGV